MIRAVVFGVAVAAGAAVAAGLVAEGGYNCSIGSSSLTGGSVYRVLPWGQTERLLFYGHIAVYPIAALVGSVAGEGWYGSRQVRALSWVFAAAPVLSIVAFIVQLRVTEVFMNIDACGPEYYPSGGLARLIGPEVGITVLIALVVGVFSWNSAAAE